VAVADWYFSSGRGCTGTHQPLQLIAVVAAADVSACIVCMPPMLHACPLQAACPAHLHLCTAGTQEFNV